MALTPRQRNLRKGAGLLFFLSLLCLLGGGFLIYGGLSGLVAERDAWPAIIWGVVVLAAGLGLAAWGRSCRRKAFGGMDPVVGEEYRDWRSFAPFPKKGPSVTPRGWYSLPPEQSRAGAAVAFLIIGSAFVALPLFLFFGPASDDGCFVHGFLSIFVAVGAICVLAGIQMVLRLLMAGGTTLQVNKEPLAPGEEFLVELYQPGNFAIEYASMNLICEEVARWSEGTGKQQRTVTRTGKVFEMELASARDLRASNTTPILRDMVAIPHDAMHSFHMRHATVRWAIRTHLVIPRRPDIRERYALRVC